MTLQEQAARRGYTIPVVIDAGWQTLEGWAKPGADFDDEFRIVCAYTGDVLGIQGWNCTTEVE